MARTAPALADLYPRLATAVVHIAEAHRVANPGTALCLIWGIRTPAEQQSAYAAGRTRIDGVKRHSLHAYGLAADLWVYTDAFGDCRLYENRPPRDEGLRLELLQRGSLKRWYIPMARLAEDIDPAIEAGALWRTLKDGPHIQIGPLHERVRILQTLLESRGFDPGPVDGECGPLTRAAMERAGCSCGIPWDVSRRQRRLMPCHPDLFRWLMAPRVS